MNAEIIIAVADKDSQNIIENVLLENHSDNLQIKKSEAKSVGISGSEGFVFLVALAGASSGWLTKKIADEYIWPLIKNRIDKYIVVRNIDE